MIPVKKVIIDRAEGPCHLCKAKEFNNLGDASRWLVGQSTTFPKGGCYDKHDLKVVFEDGETYEGRLDCKHFSEPDNDLDVLDHIRSTCEWVAGRAKNPWCGEEKYWESLKRYGQETVNAYGEFLDKYLD